MFSVLKDRFLPHDAAVYGSLLMGRTNQKIPTKKEALGRIGQEGPTKYEGPLRPLALEHPPFWPIRM